ncbi:GNAT family N-acetyltransferase [Neolewinella persica]|uniref:GNAT family N-acetyltransferase n=1 Tax=Neolewinella persica TaxID=70998 RepID=UPI000377976E|nr:GNAT family N-acetyltransferase [Neolewinella persica]
MIDIPSPTERLTLRRATLEDAPFFLELLNSKGWLDNIGDRGVYTLEDAKEYITDRILKSYEVPGCGPMLCCLKTDGTIIGNTGVYDRPGLDLPDFGFAFLDQYQRQGYAHEASISNMAYAQKHGHTELLAITLPINQPSIRLLEKLGFTREPELIRIEGDEEELMLLRWRKR